MTACAELGACCHCGEPGPLRVLAFKWVRGVGNVVTRRGYQCDACRAALDHRADLGRTYHLAPSSLEFRMGLEAEHRCQDHRAADRVGAYCTTCGASLPPTPGDR